MVKNPPANAGDVRDTGSIPGVGNGNLLQYSCLGNSMDRGAWWVTVHGVAESDMTEVTEHRHSTCPLSQWCCLTISSSASLFSCPQSFQASRSFPVSWLFTSGGQIIGASAYILLMNIQGWFLIEVTSLVSLQSKELSGVFSSTAVQKDQFLGTQPSLWSNSHIHAWLLEKL